MLFISFKLSASRRAYYQARGFGLLQVLLLISVMAGLATTGYLQWRARALVDASRQERQILAQADQAILGFATVARRLPCPDTNRDGEEDCGATDQKGWLPSVTLRLAGADPGVGVGQLRYLVQRGAGANNLTVLSDTWRPLEYDETDKFTHMRASSYAGAEIQTLTDFCQRLETARNTSINPGLARVNSTVARSVAYALAHPGNDDADGDGDLFDGANTQTGINVDLMEDPIRRPVLALYNDIVLERSFSSLQQDLHCQSLSDSINTVALAHDVVTQVAEMRDDNISSATRAVAFSTLAAIMTGLEIALAIAEGASDAGNAAIDWVTCAASLGLAVNACAAAPQHTAAIALAGGVIYANGVAVGLNAVAAGIAGTALLLASNTVSLTDACPPRDTSLLSNALVTAEKGVTDATAARIAVENEIAQKTTELNNAKNDRTAAVTNLRNIIKGTGTSSQIDGYIDPLLNAAGTWGDAYYNFKGTETRLNQAILAKDNWTAEVNKYNSMLAADAASTISALNAEITALDAQIAAARAANPTTEDQLQALRNLEAKRDGKKADIEIVKSIADIPRLDAELAALDAQIATNPPNKAELQSLRDKKAQSNLFKNVQSKAVAELSAAQAEFNNATTAKNTATTAYNSASTSYQTAYTNLVTAAGRYEIYNSTPANIKYQCTNGCLGNNGNGNGNNEVNISVAFYNSLADLFGSSANINPSFDAKYLKPVKLQKELDALNSKLNAAIERETQAKNQRDQVKQMVNNPAPCNAAGTAIVPMTPQQAEDILAEVDRKGGTR